MSIDTADVSLAGDEPDPSASKVADATIKRAEATVSPILSDATTPDAGHLVDGFA